MEGNTKLDLLMKVPNETDIAPVNLYFGIHRSNNNPVLVDMKKDKLYSGVYFALTNHTIRPDSDLTSKQHINKKELLENAIECI